MDFKQMVFNSKIKYKVVINNSFINHYMEIIHTFTFINHIMEFKIIIIMEYNYTYYDNHNNYPIYLFLNVITLHLIF